MYYVYVQEYQEQSPIANQIVPKKTNNLFLVPDGSDDIVASLPSKPTASFTFIKGTVLRDLLKGQCYVIFLNKNWDRGTVGV